MPKKSNLPIEVHDHFRLANILHGYVQKDLGEASKHALETGQELLAAKAAIPHGGWETECERIFDASLRTAQFYMSFAKDFGQLKSAQKSALLMLEGTLDGAAKAARKAARPESPGKPDPPDVGPDPNSDPPKASESPETASKPETDSESPPPPKARQRTTGKAGGVNSGKPRKQFPRSHWFKQWEQGIGPLVRLVDRIADEVREKHDPHHEAVQEFLEKATEEMTEWMGVKK